MAIVYESLKEAIENKNPYFDKATFILQIELFESTRKISMDQRNELTTLVDTVYAAIVTESQS